MASGKASINGFLKTVLKEKSCTLERPAMCRFMEYSAVITIMPESRSRTCRRTWMRPVTAPAMAPAARDAGRVSSGGKPAEIISAVTAAPSGKVESTDISGKSSILNVMYTPRANMA